MVGIQQVFEMCLAHSRQYIFSELEILCLTQYAHVCTQENTRWNEPIFQMGNLRLSQGQ